MQQKRVLLAVSLTLGVVFLSSVYYVISTTGAFSPSKPDPSLVTMPPKAKKEEDHARFYKGYREFLANDVDQAAQTFREGISENPDSADSHYGMAFTLNRQGDKEGALKEYSAAIKANPRMAEAYNDRGNLEMGQKNYDDAIRDYSYAILIAPWNAANYEDRAETYLTTKNYKRVIEDATKAISIDKNLTRALQYRAQAWLATGSVEQAKADLLEAIKNEKETTFALQARAELYETTGDLQEALKDLEPVIAKQKDNVVLLKKRSELYARLRQFDKAIADAKHIQSLSKNSDGEQSAADKWLGTLQDMDYDYKHPDLSPAERMPLLCAALYWERHGMGTYSLYGCEPNEINKQAAKDQLSDSYYVNSKDEVLRALSRLKDGGDSKYWHIAGNAIADGASQFQVAIIHMKEHYGHDDNLPKQTELRKHFIEYGDKDLLGWDLSRYILVTRDAYLAGYLTREETLSNLKEAGAILQSKFATYKDAASNMLEGKSMYSNEAWSEAQPELEPIMRRLCTDKKSIWTEVPFKIDLQVSKSKEN